MSFPTGNVTLTQNTVTVAAMRLCLLALVFAVTAAHAQSVNPTQPYIQTCTGIGTTKVTCQYVLLSTIQIPGPQGPVGPAGPSGPQGNAGQSGAVGPQGPQGPAGQNGTNGADGAQGSQGIPGVAGPAGQNGANGAQGPQGPIGPAGPQIPGLTSDGSNGIVVAGKVAATALQSSPGNGTLAITYQGITYLCVPAPGAMTCTVQ
jgi:Collagen triple helix repeat (20 copies)